MFRDKHKNINKSKYLNFSLNNKTNPTTDNTPNQTADSTTKVYRGFGGKRVCVSFKCNAELWKIFKQLCKENGISICHILESVISTYVALAQQKVNFGRTIVINDLNVYREVRRVRRYALEPDGVVGGSGVYCPVYGRMVSVRVDCFNCGNVRCREEVLRLVGLGK